MVAMPEYSQSAYRFGDYVAKFGVFPLGEEQKKLEKETIPDDAPGNAIVSLSCPMFTIPQGTEYLTKT